MVKVEVEANELRNGDIKKISLVTNGAIRAPFKILKTEEIEEGKTGLKSTLAKVFGQVDTADKTRVVALFVRKSVARDWLPIIKNHGFRAERDHASLEGDILVLKQEGFDEDEEGAVVALNQDVAVQLSHVSKYFDPYPLSSSFEENVAAGSFWPGVSNAFSSLENTVWSVLNEADSPEEAAADVSKQVKAFSKYINSLVAELPGTVFKMEQEWLTKKFEGSNVSSTDTKITLDEEADMSGTPVLKEAAAGDLDGLLDDAPAADAVVAKADAEADASATETIVETPVQFFKGDEQLTKEAFEALADEDEVIVKQEGEDDKTMTKAAIVKGDEGAPKTGGSPGNPVVDNTSDTGAIQLDEGGVPAGFRKEERIVKELVEGQLVEKTQLWFVNDDKEEIFGGYVEKQEDEKPAADKTEYTPEQVKLFEAMGVMTKTLEGISETLTAQTARIDAVEKTAGDAKETAEEVVVLAPTDDDLSNPVATRSQQVLNKKEGEVEDVFKGLLPQLESNAA